MARITTASTVGLDCRPVLFEPIDVSGRVDRRRPIDEQQRCCVNVAVRERRGIVGDSGNCAAAVLETDRGRTVRVLFEPGYHRVDESRRDFRNEACLRIGSYGARIVRVPGSLQRNVVDRL
jgi:hypothetical protein